MKTPKYETLKKIAELLQEEGFNSDDMETELGVDENDNEIIPTQEWNHFVDTNTDTLHELRTIIENYF